MKKLFRAKETFEPLYYEGDLFKIIKVNTNPDLMELECIRLKDGKIYDGKDGKNGKNILPINKY